MHTISCPGDTVVTIVACSHTFYSDLLFIQSAFWKQRNPFSLFWKTQFNEENAVVACIATLAKSSANRNGSIPFYLSSDSNFTEGPWIVLCLLKSKISKCWKVSLFVKCTYQQGKGYPFLKTFVHPQLPW